MFLTGSWLPIYRLLVGKLPIAWPGGGQAAIAPAGP
jgi:hypothetical protein